MNIKDSPLLWKFDNNDTEIDLSKIEALSSNEASPIWYSYIPNVDHLMKIKKRDDKTYHFVKDFYITGDEQEEKLLLSNEFSFFKDKRINILWGPNTGVRVDFDYFLKYWDDFLYLDDDSVIICDTENSKVFVPLCEEHVFIAEKYRKPDEG